MVELAGSGTGNDFPRATLVPSKRRGISIVWIIPIVAALVAIGIAVNRILNEGPTITVVFQSVEGLEAGKTVIKYKDVKIGQVTAVELYEDYSKVMVTARIDKHAEGLMVDGAMFWVVQPHITLSGVSGLGTLLSGNYIGFEKGDSNKRQLRFTGLQVAPIIAIDQPGRQFRLTAADTGSLGVGSPIYFRRLRVGQVMTSKLAADGHSVEIKVFVNAPYDRFVSKATRFWNASGLDVSLGAGGVDVRTESLASLLIGGVAFETPTFAPTDEPAPADTAFTLYGDRSTAMKQPETIARYYVAYFSESLRGLSEGAPVTLLGLPAGEVTRVGIDMDPKTLTVRGRIELVAHPERLLARLHTQQSGSGQTMMENEGESHAFFERLIEERGLRGQLRSGSLITGKLYVAFDFFPDAEKVDVDWSQGIPVVPTVPSVVPDLETKVTSILAKLDKIPYEAIGTNLEAALATLNQAIKEIDKAVGQFDTKVTPELKPAIAAFRRAMGTANRVLKDTDATLLGRDAPGQLELRAALQEVTRAARSIRVLSDYIERHPAALIKGKSREKH